MKAHLFHCVSANFKKKKNMLFFFSFLYLSGSNVLSLLFRVDACSFSNIQFPLTIFIYQFWNCPSPGGFNFL